MHEPGRNNPHALRHNPQLLVATALLGHALADGVAGLVTNHPQVLYHPDLTPVFSLAGAQGAIVLSGAVGKGRLVAISDASIFINNMLEFPGNRAFAINLLRFLRAGGHTRLYLAGSDTRFRADSRRMHVDKPFAQIAASLARLAQPRLPALAVLALAIALSTLLLAAIATSLPRRSAYARRAYLQAPECAAGMAGRVSHYASGERSFLQPLLVLKLEIEGRLNERAHSGDAAASSELLRELEVHAGPDLVRELSAFTASMERFQVGALGMHPQPVSARQFSELVASGRRILAGLDAAPTEVHERHE
jgi:hypothetical protein